MRGPPTLPVTLALSLSTSGLPAKAYVLHNDNGSVYVPREDLYMVCVCGGGRGREDLYMACGGWGGVGGWVWRQG